MREPYGDEILLPHPSNRNVGLPTIGPVAIGRAEADTVAGDGITVIRGHRKDQEPPRVKVAQRRHARDDVLQEPCDGVREVEWGGGVFIAPGSLLFFIVKSVLLDRPAWC